MDQDRLDRLARSLSGIASRREALRVVAASLLPTAAAAGMAPELEAKRKKKKKGKKACTPACEGDLVCIAGVCGCENGTVCGTRCCGAGQTCRDDACQGPCTPNCTDRTCGSDGCGGSCGSCGPGQTCRGGECVSTCVPDCQRKVCGSDGCGGSCGECASGQTCTSGQCTGGSPPPSGGGGGGGTGPAPCTPNCGGRVCGADGCGGSCGSCPGAQVCRDGECCAAANACPSYCCSETSVCVVNARNESTCCDPARACGTTCCDWDQTVCIGGQTCCTPQRACGTVCCSTGQACFQGACIATDSLDAAFSRQVPEEVTLRLDPIDVAFDEAGNLFVLDSAGETGRARVMKFDAAGTLQDDWDMSSYLSSPAGLAVGPGGLVYVTDSQLDRVFRLELDTGEVTHWGAYGLSVGRFSYPKGIAANSLGHVFVADHGNNRIQKFTAAGDFLATISRYGPNPENQLYSASDVALDANGDVFVAHGGYPTGLPKFSGNGQYLSFMAMNQSVGSIALDQAGNLFGLAAGNHRILKLDASGTLLLTFGSPGSAPGELDEGYGSGVACRANGNLVVADTGNHRLQEFAGDGAFVSEINGSGADPGQLHLPVAVAVDSIGRVVVVDRRGARVNRYASSGEHLVSWDTSDPPTNLTVDEPYAAVAIAADGSVYVAEYNRDTVAKFDRDGNLLVRWGGAGSSNGRFDRPVGIAIDGAGAVYVADRNNYRVQKFTSSGAYLLTLGGYGFADGKFSTKVEAVSIGPDGLVYVLDEFGRIHRLSPSGQFASRWLTEEDYTPEAHSMALDPSGSVYLVDRDRYEGGPYRVRVFNAAGGFVGGWETDLERPEIAIDAQGLIYLTDPVGDRIAVYRLNPQPRSLRSATRNRAGARKRRRAGVQRGS